MAIFTAALVIAWAGGSGLTTYLNRSASGGSSGGGRNAGAVAVTWDGGSLTNQQVRDLTMRRHIFNAFLQRVEMEGRRKAYEAGVDPSQLRVQMLAGPDTPQEGIERSVVNTRLFADAARQAGMRVSDEAIVQYLDELGRGNVSRDQMRTILGGLQSAGGRVAIDEVMATLREEMLARNYIASNQYAFVTVTPEQRWKDWLSVNDRVVIEAAAIPADSFLVDVKEPTEAELQEFFDKYKGSEPGPDLELFLRYNVELPSPTPGFRIPRKVDLQFIEANYDSFLAKAEGKVTDEEIAKFYEENKDPMFIKTDTGLMEDKGKGEKKDAGTPESEAAKPPLGRELGAERQAADAKPNDAGAAPADGKAVDGQKPAAPGDAPPPAKDGKTDDAAKDGKQSLLEGHPSKRVFHLAAFLQDAAKGDAAKNDAAKADAGAATETKAADSATKPAESTPPAAPAALPAPPAPPAAPGAAPPAAATTPPPAPKKPPEFQPLEEVKDVIRRQLAVGKAAEELDKLAGDIDQQLDSDFQKYFSEKLSAEADKQTPPAPPKSLTDLAPLAEKNGLTSGATGPKSFLQMRETPVGKSATADADQPLLPLLYAGRKLDLYQPVSTKDILGNHFIASKKSDTPGRVPTLAEVRDEVVKAWKAQKAADLAEKHAEELAKKAQQSKSPLPNFFADDPSNSSVKVVRTDAFSELTGGDVGVVNGQLQQQPYRLSRPEGVVAAGPDFLKRVVQLKDGEVAALLNHDHSIAYVVRLVEHQPPLNELRTAYLAEANSWPGLYPTIQGHRQEVRNYLENDILAGANLKWERKKDVEQEQQDQSTPEDEGSSGG